MTCKIPVELQDSYRKSDSYPENLIPSDIFTNKSKLRSYRRRLDDVENDFCLMTKKDEVIGTFEIPVIDIGTADGKGKVIAAIFEEVLNYGQHAKSYTCIHRKR
jgi:hypothetical protein